MCGICGIVSFNDNKPVKEEEIKKMTDRITHRGPDDWGIFINKPSVGLGMRRLSIIDLATGKQPIHNEKGDVQIVFNGEIYNFKELREDLEKKGHKFYTSSDTEVIVHLYEEYNTECLKFLRGMFVFAIWDDDEKRLFVARDRLGIKPFHYTVDDRRIVFGSEIKSILCCEGVNRQLDYSALDRYLTFEYIPTPQTIFKNIRKLSPGHYLIYQRGTIKINKYWDINFTKRKDFNRDEFIETFKESVKYRLISDVPLGAFLSGGIDSSSVVALMTQLSNKPVKTFSIGFEDKTYNELKYARIISRKFNTDHREFILEPNIPSLINKLVDYLDEPLADFSIIPTYLVSQMARQYVTVALSGDGGDEIFAGYETYLAQKLSRVYGKLPFFLRHKFVNPLLRKVPPSAQKKGLVNYLRRFTAGEVLPAELQHVRWMIFLRDDEREKLYSSDFQKELENVDVYQPWKEYFSRMAGENFLNQDQYVDIKTYLCEDILLKVDRMSMANSLEVRVPILDHRLVELAASFPPSLRLKDFSTKFIFKKTMEQILPKEIIYRQKQGFSIPVKNWFRKDLKSMLLEVLSEEQIEKHRLFNYSYIERLIKEHLEGKENHSHCLWALMIFNLWQERYQVN